MDTLQNSLALAGHSLQNSFRTIIRWLAEPKNWRKKRTYALLIVTLRVLYVFMNEKGLNPFKKSLSSDHVFLTGAGSGIGRLMAVRLGKLGCKLSLSDINSAGLEETKDLCVKLGVPAGNICTFVCDVSKSADIKNGANTARSAHGNVTVLINNAGIVSGKTTMELSEAMITKTLRVNTISHL